MDMQNLNKLLMEHCTEAHFEALLQMIDRLHDAAAADCLETVSPMDPREILGWLDDIIYTAEETMREIQAGLTVTDFGRIWSDN
jgi:hypothetical protein